MRQMLLVARRDLAAYLNSFWGYAVIAALLLIDGVSSMRPGTAARARCPCHSCYPC